VVGIFIGTFFTDLSQKGSFIVHTHDSVIFIVIYGVRHCGNTKAHRFYFQSQSVAVGLGHYYISKPSVAGEI